MKLVNCPICDTPKPKYQLLRAMHHITCTNYDCMFSVTDKFKKRIIREWNNQEQ